MGLTNVRAGKVVDSAAWLMKPLPGYGEFSPFNVRVHGITPAQVRGVPDWRGLHGRMLDFIGGETLVGHNVGFEKSLIAKAGEASGLEVPDLEYRCTLWLAREHLQLARYKLSDVAGALELPAFNHHDAGADARASALIAIELARRSGAGTLDALWPAPVARRPGGLAAS